jgi:hypothetical protein
MVVDIRGIAGGTIEHASVGRKGLQKLSVCAWPPKPKVVSALERLVATRGLIEVLQLASYTHTCDGAGLISVSVLQAAKRRFLHSFFYTCYRKISSKREVSKRSVAARRRRRLKC